MPNRLLQNIVFSDKNKDGVIVRIKIVNGPLKDKEFQAKKVQEIINSHIINCYHIVDNDINTYFTEKNILEI